MLKVVSAGLVAVVLLGSGGLVRAEVPDPPAPGFTIRYIPVEAQNNSQSTYHFGLSVLGLQEGPDFTPFLSIAIQFTERGANEWMALWNLSDGGTGIGSQFKALIPNLWRASGKNEPVAEIELGSEVPKPYLTWNSKRRRAWAEMRWAAARTANNLVTVMRPVQFLFKNYLYHRDDTAERRFYQTYTLLRLYEEVSALQPSPNHLSASGLTDLKYHLIINRSSFGVFAEDGDAATVVGRFESALRETTGQVSCYTHDAANQFYLQFDEVPYGLPGRPPVARAGLLSVRKSELPDDLPEWPANNLFSLSFDPFSHPEIREMMDRHPDEDIPLGIYVFGSELKAKPVLVVDFFNPSNPKKRKATGTLKVALDNFLSLQSIPWFGKILKSTVDYGIAKKDFSYFNKFSAALGVEPIRLFARMDWNFDTDTNHLLIQSVENAVGNPMVAAASREYFNLQKNFAALLGDTSAGLGLFLRTLYEDRIRSDLDLGRKAIFAEDLERYRTNRQYAQAVEMVRTFNRQAHLPSTAWSGLVSALEFLELLDRPDGRQDLIEAKEKVALLFPDRVPTELRMAVGRLLNRELRASGNPVDRKAEGIGFPNRNGG